MRKIVLVIFEISSDVPSRSCLPLLWRGRRNEIVSSSQTMPGDPILFTSPCEGSGLSGRGILLQRKSSCVTLKSQTDRETFGNFGHSLSGRLGTQIGGLNTSKPVVF